MIARRTTARTRSRPIAVSPRAVASAPLAAEDDRVARQNRHRDDQRESVFSPSSPVCSGRRAGAGEKRQEMRLTYRRRDSLLSAALLTRISLPPHRHARPSPIAALPRLCRFPAEKVPPIARRRAPTSGLPHVELPCETRADLASKQSTPHDRLAPLLTIGAVYIDARDFTPLSLAPSRRRDEKRRPSCLTSALQFLSRSQFLVSRASL